MNKLLAIVGPTASGKSALALELAKKFGGEIICADSRTVYRYMDIGTAKPSKDELMQVPHHLVDIADPNQTVTAAQFKCLAEAAIQDVQSRGKLPILVGGSGLYIDSVLFNYQFPSMNAEVRTQNARKSLNQLVSELEAADPEVAATIDLKNRRRVERALETLGEDRAKSTDIRQDTLVLGIVVNKELLQSRILTRAKKMLSEGLIEEVRSIAGQFGWELDSMTGPAYRAFKDVVLGTKPEVVGLADFAHGDMLLAKKQMTWFKRNPHINWLDGGDPAKLEAEATKLVEQFLH